MLPISVRFDIQMHTSVLFFFNDTAPTEIYTLSLHDALPISGLRRCGGCRDGRLDDRDVQRSEEHTSELQSLTNLVCRLLLEKKKNKFCRVPGWSRQNLDVRA